MNSFKKKKIFHSCRYQNPNFTLVWQSRRARVVHEGFLSHSCRPCVARVTLASHMSPVPHLRHSCLARVIVTTRSRRMPN